MEIQQHQSVTPSNSAPVAYLQAGSGPDVILIHGAMTGSQDMALGLFPTLSEHFRVTAFDRPGHGRSGRTGSTGSPWRQAAAIHAAAKALGLERVVVIGHSFGGAVAMSYAMQFPMETAGVLALAPIAFPELRLEHLYFAPRAAGLSGGVWNAVAATCLDPLLLPLLWHAMFLPQAMPERFASTFPFDLPARPIQTQANGEDSLQMIPGLALSALNYRICRPPVRVLAGACDPVVNNRLHGGLMSRLVPDGEYAELPGLGHMLHHFAQEPILKATHELAQ